MLKTHLPGYQKHVDFTAVAGGVEDALARAQHLDQDAKEMGEAGRNPTTGMYRLVNSITGKR